MSAEKKAVRHINLRKAGKDISINIVILIVSLIMLFPLFWIMITACKGQIEILKNPLAIIPDEFYLFKNFKTVWERADWLLYYKNSILLTVCTLPP